MSCAGIAAFERARRQQEDGGHNLGAAAEAFRAPPVIPQFVHAPQVTTFWDRPGRTIPSPVSFGSLDDCPKRERGEIGDSSNRSLLSEYFSIGSAWYGQAPRRGMQDIPARNAK